jgi:hypothetical protein
MEELSERVYKWEKTKQNKNCNEMTSSYCCQELVWLSSSWSWDNDNEYLVLRFEELEFRVLNINTATRTFTIARLDLWDGPCPPPSVLFQTTTLNYTLFDYASIVENITLLYDCPPPQDNIPAAPNRFNCSQFGVSDGKINAYSVDKSTLGIRHLPQWCNQIIKRTKKNDMGYFKRAVIFNSYFKGTVTS